MSSKIITAFPTLRCRSLRRRVYRDTYAVVRRLGRMEMEDMP